MKTTMRNVFPLLATLLLPLATLRAATDDLSWMRGANYVPSYAKNDVQTWMEYDPVVIDRELGYAERLKLNTVRVFLNVAVFEHQPEKFLADFENFLALADKHGIKVMPVLFDSCMDPQEVDVNNYKGKNWIPSPGFPRLGDKDWPVMEKFIAAFVGKYRDDKRIVLWDVMNEPEATRYWWKTEDRKVIVDFLRRALQRTREEHPVQPRGIGWAFSKSIDLAADLSDVLIIHNYPHLQDLATDIRQVKELGKAMNKPVIINEFAMRPKQPIEKALPIVVKEKIGWCFWELMVGNTQFAQGRIPMQGHVYPDGKCFSVAEIATILNPDGFTGDAEEIARKAGFAVSEKAPKPFTEESIAFSLCWDKWTGDGPEGKRLWHCQAAGQTATKEVSGTSIELIFKHGPDCGIASVTIDGKPAAVSEIDTYAKEDDWNKKTVVAKDLPPGKHTVAITVTGRKAAAATNSLVQLVNIRGAEQPWPAEKAWQWYKKQPWIVGFNFVPSTASNTTELWSAETFDAPTIDKELGMGAKLGFNSCRVFVQYIVWKSDPEGLKKRIGQFLSMAQSHGLSTTLVLFDDCSFGSPPQTEPFMGKQREPIPGMILPSWTPSPGLKEVTDQTVWPDLESYVKDIVGTFGKDKRVLMWDLYNEAGNSGMGNKSRPLVQAAFSWARQTGPEQPLTTCWQALDLSDVISFHAYTDDKGMLKEITKMKGHGRPVICTEWMARPAGSKWTDLPLFKQTGVGCYNWGLVNGRTQCQFSWKDKPGTPEPKVWFHDLFHKDGTPYDPAEHEVIRKTTADKKIDWAAVDPSAAVQQPPAKDALQGLRKLMHTPLRDPSICRGPDGTFYLAGTSEPFWGFNNKNGIRIWKSKDLIAWEPLGTVWRYGASPWHEKYLKAKKPLWAPEIHYIKGTFWLTYSMPGDRVGDHYEGSGSGLLKSTTGKPEGPYQDVQPNERLGDEIDASLFEDDDGATYFLWHSGKIAKMKPDMSGLAEPFHWLRTTTTDPDPQNHSGLCAMIFGKGSFDHVGFEGVFMFKRAGTYYLCCAEVIEGRYSCMVATATNIYGPYSPRYEAIPNGGHNTFFQDGKGNWWSTYFGPPFRERPAILPIRFNAAGRIEAVGLEPNSTGPAPKAFTEDSTTFSPLWEKWEGTGPAGDRLWYGSDAGETATKEVAGTSISVIFKHGPDCGIAGVTVDGKPAAVAEIDTYAKEIEWNKKTVVATDLPAGKHTVTVTVTGRKNAAAKGRYVQLVNIVGS